MALLHGTTRRRAERILALGPDPLFREPGGQVSDSGFSAYLDRGPFLFGDPDEYARGKAKEFPDEGGPAMLVFDVPDEILQKAATEWFPLV
jgi:hypothetical protein